MCTCKFKCVSKTLIEGGMAQINLAPVTEGSIENKTFFKYTPSGEINIGTVNAEVAEKFKPGKQYYVDFTEAE